MTIFSSGGYEKPKPQWKLISRLVIGERALEINATSFFGQQIDPDDGPYIASEIVRVPIDYKLKKDEHEVRY